MEVFAGFMAQADHEVGRVIDTFRQIGQLDNTLVVYIAGDNGASLEGGLSGNGQPDGEHQRPPDVGRRTS